jgi:hypothetical protein
MVRGGRQEQTVSLQTRPYGHQLQPTKVPLGPSCIGAYDYRLKALFFAHLNFLVDFRGQMSLPGEKSSMNRKEEKPKTGYKNKNEDLRWSQNSQKRPENPA